MSNAWGADPLNQDELVKLESPRPLMREISPGEPFPIHALGPVLRPMAEAAHDRVQAPMAICAQSVLATAGRWQFRGMSTSLCRSARSSRFRSF